MMRVVCEKEVVALPLRRARILVIVLNSLLLILIWLHIRQQAGGATVWSAFKDLMTLNVGIWAYVKCSRESDIFSCYEVHRTRTKEGGLECRVHTRHTGGMLSHIILSAIDLHTIETRLLQADGAPSETEKLGWIIQNDERRQIEDFDEIDVNRGADFWIVVLPPDHRRARAFSARGELHLSFEYTVMGGQRRILEGILPFDENFGGFVE